MFTEDQKVQGLPDTQWEYHTGLVTSVDLESKVVTVCVTDHEFNEDELGENYIWDFADIIPASVQIDTYQTGTSTESAMETPSMPAAIRFSESETETALILGLI